MARTKRKPKRRRRPAAVTPQNDSSQRANSQAVSLIQSALQLQQQGDFDLAKQVYCQVLEQDPLNPDAWNLLGMTLCSVSEYSAALECLQKANAIVPNHPQVLENLGLVYRGLGQHENAIACLQQSLSLNPDSASARNNLGTMLLEQGQLEAAEHQFQQAVNLDPSLRNASTNLGNVWQKQGRMRDAENAYRTILQDNPNDPLALANLGEALRKQAKWDEAVDVLKRAAQLDPGLVESELNLGRTLLNISRHEEAKELFLRLLQRHPNLAKAHHYLGRSFFNLRDMTSAQRHISRALEIDPDDVYAISSLGFVLLDMGRREDAAKCFRETVERDASMSDAHGSLLYLMSGDPDMPPEQLFEEHQRWGELHGTVKTIGSHSNAVVRDRRLRIGYVSPDLRQHVVASYFRPVLESHNADQVETYCYAEVAVPDKTTHRLQELADHWRSTNGLSSLQVAQRIAEDKIDILVDLAGHTAGNRLPAFAYRPAPIQMTWLGYPNTTGLPAIDYRLTCETQNPTGQPTYHVEELIRMPGGSFCFEMPGHAPRLQPGPVEKNGFVTFGSLHRPFKISDRVRDLWASVMRRCCEARLLIFNSRFTDESATELAEALIDRGVTEDRFEIRHAFKGASYLETYDEIDIALDVFPWAGGTTTLEAMWMGVPVLARYGDCRGARSTAAIVSNVGHDEWIAYSDDQYVELAAQLVSDSEPLGKLRMELRDAVARTIADAKRFTRELEDVYREVWCKWCDAQEG